MPLDPEASPAGAAPAGREEEIELAELVGVFGTSGELRVHLHNRESTWLRRWRDVTLVAPDGTRARGRLRVRAGTGGREIGTLEGLTRREEAHARMGTRVLVPRGALPPPAADEAYVVDLVGLEVVTTESPDAPVGRVRGVLTHCPTPILEIERPGLPVAWVPLVPGRADVDLQAGRIAVPADALEIG